MNNEKKILKNVLLATLIMFILIYGIYGARYIIWGIKIKNTNIKNNTLYKEEVIKVSGQAKKAKILTINEREITIDKSGFFEEEIILLLGYNTIDIVAMDKFGKKDIKTYNIIYQPEITPEAQEEITEEAESPTLYIP